MSSAIPTVDLADVASGDAGRRARAAEALRIGFGHFGLVYVANHGVDPELVSRLYDRFAGFTARPTAEKERYGGADIWFQRGWTPPNTEKAIVAGGQPDFKECYFACATEVDPDARAQYPQIYAENRWPEGLAGFDAAAFEADYLAMGRALHAAGEALLRAAAPSLGLPEEALVQLVGGGPHVTRILHYLPLTPEQVGTHILWGEEHTDFNLLTILPGGRFYDHGKAAPPPDAKSGLYLRTRGTAENPAGELVRGTPPPGTIVAQVGQQLEVLTGGTFLATPHVVTPPGVPGISRMSSAHFVHLHSNEVVFPLPAFRTSASCAAYGPPVLAGTYSMKTLVDIGLAPPSALDRLGYRHYDRLGTIRAADLK
jgi:isopenicillin N synthase-like dioxygenase